MDMDSLKRFPWLPVRSTLSEPARSTKWKVEVQQRPM